MKEFNQKQLEAIKSQETDIVILAPAGSGKALKNGTKILTPTGYIPIEELKIGDIVFDGDGKKTKVTGVFPQGKKEVFNVIFSDKNIIQCSSDHLWTYQTTDMRASHSKNWKTKTLKEIIETEPIKKRSGSYERANIFIPIPNYIEFDEQELPISPYLLGALLGDGSFCSSGNQVSFSNEDKSVLERVGLELKAYNNILKHSRNYDYKITSELDGIYSDFRKRIRDLELEGTNSETKFIPDIYMFNSVENRLNLLKGLIDTDGYCGGSYYEFVTISKQLADDIQFIIESLGMTVVRSIKETHYTYKGEYKSGKIAYRLYIKTSLFIPKIHFSEKREKQWKKGQSYSRRNIEKIEKTNEMVEMTCISVDSPTKLFVTEHCIVTHNTTTLVGAIIEYKKNNPSAKVVAITFTKKAADDLQSRLIDFNGIRVSTIHSWAYSELELLAKKVREKFPDNTFKVKLLEEERIKEILTDLAAKRRYKYIKIWELYSYTMGNYNIDVSENMKRLFEVVKMDYINYKELHGLYDFTDLPQYLLDKLNDYNENIENIEALFVDEFQDVDDVQIELFERVPAVKKFYIGDPQQCQPSGTKIRMADGTQKNIEDIQVGDMVVSYSASNGFITGCGHGSTGYKVLNKVSREFVNNELITIELENGLKSTYTPNHKTIVSLVENEYNFVTYLMCDENEKFRVGMSMIFVNDKAIDMVMFRKKMRDEKCTKLWILNVFKTDKEARVLEDKISYFYGIPQNTFQLDKTSYTKEDIDYIYENLDTKSNAIKCLKDFHRDINLPLIYEGFNGHFARNGSAQIFAINLMPNIMKAMCHNPLGTMKPITNKYYSTIKNVKREFISNPIIVHSLKIDRYEHYIADDIVTHNSIYIFRGATADVLNRLEDFKRHNLIINYRSYQEIIDFASSIQIKALQETVNFASEKESMRSRIECIKGSGGEVYTLNASGIAFRINEYLRRDGIKIVKEFIDRNSMILCRKNKQVKAIKEMGYPNVSTIHQAKGLEYESVIVTNFDIGPDDIEEVNIAYVAMTRAEDYLLAADYEAFVRILEKLIPEYRKTHNLF